MVCSAYREAEVVAAKPSGVRRRRLRVGGGLRRGTALGATLLGVVGVLSVVAGSGTASAGVSPGATTLVSLKSDGSQASDNPSPHGRLSGNGRYVVFSTNAVMDNAAGETSLDARNDGSGGDSDIYVRDRDTGRTTLLSFGKQLTGDEGDQHLVDVPADGDSTNPSISANGRYVAFDSYAKDIDQSGRDHDNSVDVFVCDRDPDNDGTFDERVDGQLDVYCMSVGRHETDDAGTRVAYNYDVSLSANTGDNSVLSMAWSQTQLAGSHPKIQPYQGVVVAPLQLAANGDLLPVTDSNLYNIDATLPDLDAVGTGFPIMSADGRHLVVLGFMQEPVIIGFAATAPGDRTEATVEMTLRVVPVVAGGTRFEQLRDSFERVVNTRVDVDGDGKPIGDPECCIPYGISGDGREVAFTAPEPSLNGQSAARVTNLASAKGPRSTVVSLDNAGDPGPGGEPTLSADGRFVAFSTSAPNMHGGRDDVSGRTDCNNPRGGFTAFAPNPGDPPTCSDIVVRDLVIDGQRAGRGQQPLPGELASPSETNRACASDLQPDQRCEGDADSGGPSLADNGSVAYTSMADDLVRDDANKHGSDMFVRDFRPTVTGEPIDFGVVDLGSNATRTETVRHNGFGAATITGATLTDNGGGQFTITTNGCQNVALLQGDAGTESCGISVTFTPTAAGPQHGTLRIDVAGRDPVEVPITGGVGVPADGFVARPDPLDFGQRLALSPSGPKQLTVTNAGRLPFTVRQVRMPVGPTLFGKDYKVVANTCVGRTVPVGGRCTLGISFDPHGAGTRNGAIQIMTVQQGTTAVLAHVVGLRGFSPTPTLLVNPGVVADGRVTAINGQLFAQNADVSLAIAGIADPVLAHTDGGGNFELPYLLMPHSDLGSRDVTGTVDTTTLKVTTNFLVVAGTVQPPDFSTRR
jgi:WD40-like Beta Propeller Repeat